MWCIINIHMLHCLLQWPSGVHHDVCPKLLLYTPYNKFTAIWEWVSFLPENDILALGILVPRKSLSMLLSVQVSLKT